MDNHLKIAPLEPSALDLSKDNMSRFQTASLWKARWQLINSFLPYAALWFAMDRALLISYWVMLPIAILAAGLALVLSLGSSVAQTTRPASPTSSSPMPCSCWTAINAPRLGAALSFYTALSMAPLLVFSVGIAGLVFGRKAAQGRIVWQIGRLIGPEGGAVIQNMLLESTKPTSG